uniref:Uncharacterized protein n=1 Tax=Ciona intestinalis TaxID=7719 RepID=F6ZPK3_CIOIN
MKRKRQRDPKARKRGLVASTMAKRASEEEEEEEDQSFIGDTDYRALANDQKNEEEEIRKRKEKHRRRREKKHKNKPKEEPVDSGMDATNMDEEEEHELHPLEEAELLAKQMQNSANITQPDEEMNVDQNGAPPDPIDAEEKPPEDGSDEEDDERRKKKKKKHKH